MKIKGKTMFNRMSFKKLNAMEYKWLYAGDIPQQEEYGYPSLVGLSINHSDRRHIKHNIINPMPIPDNSIDAYQAEDVFEHIEFDKLPDVINEIYRVLKPGALFRLSVPDYRCDVLLNRAIKNENGDIVFDPGGGGAYKNGKVIRGGHVWFPVYEKVLELVKHSNFSNYEFLHYYDMDGQSVLKEIDYSKGFVKRTPDHDKRVQHPRRGMSIVVDLIK